MVLAPLGPRVGGALPADELADASGSRNEIVFWRESHCQERENSQQKTTSVCRRQIDNY
jgi:hypothetical protein